MKKKSIVMLATGIILTASLVIGGTLAFFTGNATATNTFTVGEGVTITTDESPVQPDPNKPGDYVEKPGDRVTENDYNDVLPGSTLFKDPTVGNTGAIPVYARMKVTLTKGAEWTAAMANHTITDWDTIFTGIDSSKWVLKDGNPTTAANGDVVFIYEYQDVVAATNGTTGPLFTNVVIPAAFSQDEMKAITGFQILAEGQAIQATGWDTTSGTSAMEQAFAAIDGALEANAKGE